MTSLKNDDCIDMVEMMEEEQKNSQILLNAALESLEMEHTKSKSTIETQHNDLLKEEKGKYDAIRKVNHSEIERLKALIRECKAKDNIQPSNTSASANSFRRILPTDNNTNAKSNGNSVQFKVFIQNHLSIMVQTPTYITERTTGSDMKSTAMELLKKVPRRKCIRRTASTTDKVEAPKDELDLFC
uniref:Uncharacterized protein n=1 Tax=Babesia bovis TaxID=5865 RepID=A7APK3_BABBO|eukprot:XP_001612055.1 hypothetical protein [Babesia bovis T2Bo]